MLEWLCDGVAEPYKSVEADPRLAAYRRLSNSQPRPVLRAADIMSSPVETIESDQTVAQALAFMNLHWLHHLPVLDEGCLVGLASDRDLIRVQDKATQTVAEVMAQRLLTARVDTSLWSVAATMTSSRVNCVVVVDDDIQLLGILSSLDLLRCMTYQAPVEVWL